MKECTLKTMPKEWWHETATAEWRNLRAVEKEIFAKHKYAITFSDFVASRVYRGWAFLGANVEDYQKVKADAIAKLSDWNPPSQ